MNFKQICESVYEELTDRPKTFSSVDLGLNSSSEYYITDPTERRIVRRVDELYLQIQMHMQDADFMHKRGLFLTTSADNTTGIYRKCSVREVDQTSLYIIKDGSQGRSPLDYRDYQDWITVNRSGNISSGQPRWVVRLPDEKWLFWPTPNATWNVYADWWREPSNFNSATDEPIWDSSFHGILKWLAVNTLANEYEAEGTTAKRIRFDVDQMFPALKARFEARYGRTFDTPCPLT